jgi:hypothetical protein
MYNICRAQSATAGIALFSLATVQTCTKTLHLAPLPSVLLFSLYRSRKYDHADYTSRYPASPPSSISSSGKISHFSPCPAFVPTIYLEETNLNIIRLRTQTKTIFSNFIASPCNHLLLSVLITSRMTSLRREVLSKNTSSNLIPLKDGKGEQSLFSIA